MTYRCPKYLCEAVSMQGLVQQVAVSYLRHGYWWYVTGMIPQRKDPRQVDHNILTKYDIRKDWRIIAERKAKGIANLQYIRHGRFYMIMATKGRHDFKVREAKRIRDARKCPILIPLDTTADPYRPPDHRSLLNPHVFDGYAVSYRRGGYRRKTAEERANYRQRLAEWKQDSANGAKKPRPHRGEPDGKWHSRVEIERRSYQRLRTYFLEMATRRSADNLAYELQQTPYLPWQPVKQQLVRIVKQINDQRKTAGLRDQIAYRCVLSLRRPILHPFADERRAAGDGCCTDPDVIRVGDRSGLHRDCGFGRGNVGSNRHRMIPTDLPLCRGGEN